MNITAPIVGMHFRPPAKALVANLPSGTPLKLVAEPDNAYDANAIKVIVETSNIPRDEDLEMACAMMGTPPEDLYAQDEWHLAYVCSKKTGSAAKLTPILDRVVSATLGFNFKGMPEVNVEIGYGLEVVPEDEVLE